MYRLATSIFPLVLLIGNIFPINPSVFLTWLEFYRSDTPDKVFVHTDKSVYSLEDTIWSKVYLVNGINHTVSSESKIINVELINPDGVQVYSQKVYIDNIGAPLDITVPRDWKGGTYLLRAYTNYNLNSEEDYIFKKEITLVQLSELSDELNKGKPNSTVPKSFSIDSLSLKFYPESGSLIQNIECRVAVKIGLASKDNSQLKGWIEDDNGKKITEFKIHQFGYGSFYIKPDYDVDYKAIINVNGEQKSFNLPKIEESGYSIKSDQRFSDLKIHIQSTYPSLEGLTLVGHIRGEPFLDHRFEEENDGLLKINTSEIPSGVAHLTLFNEELEPLCERLIFINNIENNISISTAKKDYSKREKVDLVVSNSTLKKYDASIAVVNDNDLLVSDNGDDFRSWLLLNSDLRGKIENVQYYFSDNKDYKRQYLLDLVMMTHGWRRFVWKEIQDSDQRKGNKFGREEGIYINGKTTRKLNKNASLRSNVLLTFMDNNFNEIEQITDDEGNFRFGPFISYDTLQAFIQARKFNDKKKGKLEGNRNLNISLFDSKSNEGNFKWNSTKKYNQRENSNWSEYLSSNTLLQSIKDDAFSLSVQMEELLIVGKRKTLEDEVDEIQKNSSIYTSPSNRVINSDNRFNQSIYDLLRNVPGVQVLQNPRGQTVTIRGGGQPRTPLFLLNGTTISEDTAREIDPNTIKFIDVLKGGQAGAFGGRGGNGVIAIYSGSNSTKVRTRKPGIVDFDFNGLYRGREFYSPDYSKSYAVYSPDLRSTLYWKSDVLLSEGENIFSFYTGDGTGSYTVSIQGISDHGEVITENVTFTVE